MIYDMLKKDSMGYYIISNEVVQEEEKLPTDNISAIRKLIIDNEPYYIKSLKLPYKLQDGKLAGDCAHFYSEMVYSKLYRMFGVKTADYRLATMEDGFRGVISQDIAVKNSNATTIHDWLVDKNLKSNICSLSYLKSLGLIKKQEQTFKDKLDLACLLFVGTGNCDGHFGNIAISGDKKLKRLEDVVLLDFGLTVPAHYRLKDIEERLVGDYPEFTTKFRIDSIVGNVESFCKDLVTSPDISSKVIDNYLSTLSNLLEDDKCFKTIQEEVAEEYGLPLSQDYLDKLQLVMTKTGEVIQQSYDQRLREMGE